MADADIIFGKGKRVEIGVVQFDCAVSETHTAENVVTDHPVEDGSNITDHIKSLPRTIEVNGLVSNAPIVLEEDPRPSPITTDTGEVIDRVQTAYKKLEEIRVAGELVDVVTTLNEYKNMALTSYAVTRDAQNGNILNALLSLREVIITTTEKIEAPEPVDKSKNKTANKGKKLPKDANTEQEAKSQSVLRSLAGSFVGG